jgi:WD40 repeat protein
VAPPAGHERSVSAVAFWPDGRLVLTGSADKTARLWRVMSGTQALVDEAKMTVPRCLTPAQRQMVSPRTGGTTLV